MICTEAANTKFIVFGLTHIYHDVQNDRRSHRNKRKMKIKVTTKLKFITSMNLGIQIMLKSSLKR
jgi:hypothetical protein